MHLEAQLGLIFETALVTKEVDFAAAPWVILAPESIAMPRGIGIDKEIAFWGQLLMRSCSISATVDILGWWMEFERLLFAAAWSFGWDPGILDFQDTVFTELDSELCRCLFNRDCHFALHTCA